MHMYDFCNVILKQINILLLYHRYSFVFLFVMFQVLVGLEVFGKKQKKVIPEWIFKEFDLVREASINVWKFPLYSKESM